MRERQRRQELMRKENIIMITVQKLNYFGADVSSGLRRCSGMADFYLEMVTKVLDDTPRFDELEQAVKEGRLHEAFEIAHSLKGVYANLSLEPVLAPISRITEMLRHEEPGDYDTLIQEIREKHAELCALARED